MKAPVLHRIVDRWPGVESGMKWGTISSSPSPARCSACCACRVRRLSFKVEDGRFLELTDRPGFVPAPYLARARWVLVEAPERLPDGELDALQRRSYELVRATLTKRAQRELAD